MSSFPMASNTAHTRRYGNARQPSLRQMSEPNGVVTSTKESEHNSQHPIHHMSAEMPSFNHFQAHEKNVHKGEHGHQGMHSLARHMQHSLKLGLSPIPHLAKKSVSEDTLVRNLLPPLNNRAKGKSEAMNLETLESSFDDPIRGSRQLGQDSGFGSAFNMHHLGLGPNAGLGNRFGGVSLAGSTGTFLKAQTDSIIDALQSFVAQPQQT